MKKPNFLDFFVKKCYNEIDQNQIIAQKYIF